MRAQPRADGREPAEAQGLTIPRGRRAVPTHTNLHTRRIPVAVYVTALLLLPTLIVGGFMSAGRWAGAEKSTTAQAGLMSGHSGATVEAPATAADVKGSMTVKQVDDAFPQITAAQILARLGAPLDTPTSSQLKTLVEKGNGIDVPTLRTWLAEQGAT